MKISQKLKLNSCQKSIVKGQILRKQGFSLVEVLITLLILSVGVAAVAILMTGNIKNSIVAKDQIIASELAQEGVELVANIKSNQDLSGGVKFTTDVLSGSDYRVDYDLSAYPSNYSIFKASDVSNDSLKKLNLVSAHYLHSAGAATKFYRKISLVNVTGAAASATVTSYVTWNGTGFSTITPLSTACNIANKCVSVQAVLPDQN